MSNLERSGDPGRGSLALRLLLRTGIVMGVGVALLQAALIPPVVRGPIATRFAWDGRAVSWAGATDFLTIHLAVVASLATLFIGLPLCLRIAEQWRARTGGPASGRDRLVDFEQHTLFFGLVTTVVLLALVQLVVVANLVQPVHLGAGAFALLAAYLAFALGWTRVTIRRFRRPRPAPAPAPA